MEQHCTIWFLQITDLASKKWGMDLAQTSHSSVYRLIKVCCRHQTPSTTSVSCITAEIHRFIDYTSLDYIVHSVCKMVSLLNNIHQQPIIILSDINKLSLPNNHQCCRLLHNLLTYNTVQEITHFLKWHFELNLIMGNESFN
jgi:hypothetical protein